MRLRSSYLTRYAEIAADEVTWAFLRPRACRDCIHCREQLHHDRTLLVAFPPEFIPLGGFSFSSKNRERDAEGTDGIIEVH